MNKTALYKILRLALLLLIINSLCVPGFSNDAQVNIFNAGVNLGWAKARAELYDRATVESWILEELARTIGNINGAENLLRIYFSL